MTGKMQFFNGIPIAIPNDIIKDEKEFYISYNDRDISIYGDITTALVLKNPIKFLILNGNHTKEYNNIIKNGGTYEDCLTYFKSNLHKKSKYSENWDETIITNEDGSVTIVKNNN